MDWGWNRVSEHHGMHGWWLKVQHGSKTKYGIVRRMTSWIFRVTVVTAGWETAGWDRKQGRSIGAMNRDAPVSEDHGSSRWDFMMIINNEKKCAHSSFGRFVAVPMGEARIFPRAFLPVAKKTGSDSVMDPA